MVVVLGRLLSVGEEGGMCSREVDAGNERGCAGRSARVGDGDGLPRWLSIEIWVDCYQGGERVV